jgi:hypothetical protein
VGEKWWRLEMEWVLVYRSEYERLFAGDADYSRPLRTMKCATSKRWIMKVSSFGQASLDP